MNDTTKRTQAEIDNAIADVKTRLYQLKTAEEQRRNQYEAKRQPLHEELEALEAERFRLIHGYGIGDNLLITQEYCDYKRRTNSSAGLRTQDILGLDAVIKSANADGVSIITSAFGVGISDLNIVHRMREAWLAKNGGQS